MLRLLILVAPTPLILFHHEAHEEFPQARALGNCSLRYPTYLHPCRRRELLLSYTRSQFQARLSARAPASLYLRLLPSYRLVPWNRNYISLCSRLWRQRCF